MAETKPCPVKGVEELVSEFSDYGSVDGFMAVVIALLFFGTVYALEAVGSGIWFRPWFRGVLGDYAYPVCHNSPSSLATDILKDCYHLLDWFLAYPRYPKTSEYSNITTYPRFLPCRISPLGGRFLELTCQVGFCGDANGIPGHASLLL